MTINRKNQIAIKCSELFDKKGFVSVSMRDVAKEIGIKPASIYHHFDSKHDILVSIIMPMAIEFTKEIRLIATINGTAVKHLEKVIDLHIDMSIKYRNGMGCLNTEWIHLDKKDKKIFLNLRNEYEQHVRQFLKMGCENGKLINMNIEASIFSMLSTLRNLYIWHAKNEKMPLKELKRQMKKILLYGIVK